MPSIGSFASVAPVRFADRTLVGYVPRTVSQVKALDGARRLAAGEIRNLVLIGHTGLGKTHLAAAVVRDVTEREMAAYQAACAAVGPGDAYWPAQPVLPVWLNVADAITAMRFEMDRPSDDREMTDRVRRVRSHPGLVVLDDLGREKSSDWTGELIYAVVNARYEAMLPTLVTSNLTPTELAASTYWPSVSRLAEDGELVRVEGADQRLDR